MKMQISDKKIFTILMFGMFLIPSGVFSAQMDFEIVSTNVLTDEATIVGVYLDPEEQNLNVVEGVLKIKGSVSDDAISVFTETGDSYLKLWPTYPEYSSDERVIRFAGGNPDGIANKSLIFRIRIFSSVPQTITISTINGNAYINDGIATKEPLRSKSINVSVDSKKVPQINQNSSDDVPPTINGIEIGSDPDTYDGKYFVYIDAADDFSGIRDYFVEENFVKEKAENGIYVLKDQSLNSNIFITVTDKVGNSRSEWFDINKIVNKTRDTIILSLSVFVILLVIIFGRFFFRKRND